MLVIYSFCKADQDLAEKTAKWICELRENKNHKLLLICDKSCDPQSLISILSQTFGEVKHFFTPHDRIGWPQGPNVKFDCAARIAKFIYGEPFFWLEPDCTPIRGDWLDRIEEEYLRENKLFLGNKVVTKEDKRELMNGVGVWPSDYAEHYPSAMNCLNSPWDYVFGPEVFKSFHDTKLIQHEWRAKDFSEKGSLERLKPETILFHGCKNDSLIRKLRFRKNRIKSPNTR